MLPFPLNRGGGPDLTYTWRDTSILGKGGVTAQPGIPLQREGDLMVNAVAVGSVATGTNGIPSFGLPLLIELRVFRADAAIGLNFLDVSLAFPTTTPPPITTPSFRAYSAGGIDNLGNPHEVQPDLEVAPTGGFNAGSTPPGLRTATGTDTVFYLGQIDTVTRVSRAHTVWLDTGITTGNGPVWLPPVVEPPVQPSGTAVQIDFRGANSFSGSQAATFPYDSTRLDPYGEPNTTNYSSNPQNPPWSSNIAVAANGKKFLQIRFTFINNIATGLSPELLAIGLPYLTQ